MRLSAAFKGWVGESLMVLAKKIVLDGSVYRDLNNVTLPSSNGTTQIDHIIVSKYGIFVLETKNMGGRLSGSEKDEQWTQSFAKSEFKFQNPLRQNYRHIRVLMEFLDLPESLFHSVVCFTRSECRFKTKMPKNVMTSGYFGYIKGKKKVLLTDGQVETLFESIRSGMRPKNLLGLSTAETKREHLESLASRHASTTVCPKCGSDLLRRKTKKGADAGKEFLGCSSYPKCRFVRTA